jgi:hypothetical protein
MERRFEKIVFCQQGNYANLECSNHLLLPLCDVSLHSLSCRIAEHKIGQGISVKLFLILVDKNCAAIHFP